MEFACQKHVCLINIVTSALDQDSGLDLESVPGHHTLVAHCSSGTGWKQTASLKCNYVALYIIISFILYLVILCEQ